MSAVKIPDELGDYQLMEYRPWRDDRGEYEYFMLIYRRDIPEKKPETPSASS